MQYTVFFFGFTATILDFTYTQTKIEKTGLGRQCLITSKPLYSFNSVTSDARVDGRLVGAFSVYQDMKTERLFNKIKVFFTPTDLVFLYLPCCLR